MTNDSKLKLFISYSHKDEIEYVNEFTKHIAPLKTKGLIENWYDRNILAGEEFLEHIDANLVSADIICLCISANFLASAACMNEKRAALALMKTKGISVIPIILSPCGWLDDLEISKLLALPTDGEPITDFAVSATAWNNVYEGLKKIIERDIKYKQLEVSREFCDFLTNTDLLTKAHAKREALLLDDIFVYPELTKYDDLKEYDGKESSKILIESFLEYSKVVIAGEDQSGKTSLCKKLFIELRRKNLIPIYLSDKYGGYLGNIENKISAAFSKQYVNLTFEEIDKIRILPIVDDFHYARNKEKIIRELLDYNHLVLIVDDIYKLNFNDDSLLKSFQHFKIRQFKPSLRNEIIRKWVTLGTSDKIPQNENSVYKDIDSTTELVDSALGRILGSGIMPAYPFFILSIISTYETFEKPLDQEITSQGYCYQALIYLYLRKQGVKSDEIDTYINFLTEIAFYFYDKKLNELSKDDFEDFMKIYLGKFNLPIETDELLTNLQKTNIITLDSFNNCSFSYSYLYYFFVGKYFAEHIDENKPKINQIINNLHKNENAYIAIFISHHSKNAYILNEIISNASNLFEKYTPATLTKEELSFFDTKVDIIIKAVLPPPNSTPESERQKILASKDESESIASSKEINEEAEDIDDEFARELRRSIKTVEVMGRIIKNRAGSLEKEKLISVFKSGMNVHLRILSSFLMLIKDEANQKEIGDYIIARLDLITQGSEKKPSTDQLEKLSRKIFWNTNFSVVIGFLNKIIHSLGSNKLTNIVKEVCDEYNTPATFIVKHGILMWYNKNLQIDNIANRIEEQDFSKTAINIIKHKIVNHCNIHMVGFKEKQKIEHRINIPSKLLMKRGQSKQ